LTIASAAHQFRQTILHQNGVVVFSLPMQRASDIGELPHKRAPIEAQKVCCAHA
jgi:hypothetical protein